MRFKTKPDKATLAKILNDAFLLFGNDEITLTKATLTRWAALLGTSGQGTKQTVKAEIEALLAREEELKT